MKWQSSALILLDQTKLPINVEFIECKDYKRVIDAIKRLEVRGAPAIGAAAGFAMVLALKEIISEENLLASYAVRRDEIIAARPTAVNLEWAANLLYTSVEEMLEAKLDSVLILANIEKLALKIYDTDIEKNKTMGTFGAEIMPEKAIVLTHCNAGALATCGYGTALGVIRAAYEVGKLKMVYSDETRPLLQGSRLTAWELLEDGIPVTTITDNMAAWTILKKGINAIVVGADRIASNGDTANKIGTYGLAVLAKEHNIPFYIAAPASTFDFDIATGDEIKIEERSGDEVRMFQGIPSAPPNVAVFNPGFDVTPGDLITGIITEYGVLEKPYISAIAKLKENVSKENLFTWKA